MADCLEQWFWLVSPLMGLVFLNWRFINATLRLQLQSRLQSLSQFYNITVAITVRSTLVVPRFSFDGVGFQSVFRCRFNSETPLSVPGFHLCLNLRLIYYSLFNLISRFSHSSDVDWTSPKDYYF